MKLTRTQLMRRALSAMAYREKAPGFWLKPVGWQLLSFRESSGVHTTYFKAATGELSVWTHHELSGDPAQDLLRFLKDSERSSRLDMHPIDSHFELSSRDDDLAEFLG